MLSTQQVGDLLFLILHNCSTKCSKLSIFW